MGHSLKKVFPYLHILFLIFLITLNVIPLGKADSSLSSSKIALFRLDYIVHYAIFLSFAWLFSFSRIWHFRFFKSNELLYYCLMVLVSGVLMEYLQLLTPWRTFNPLDLLANTLGALFSILFILLGAYLDKKR